MIYNSREFPMENPITPTQEQKLQKSENVFNLVVIQTLKHVAMVTKCEIKGVSLFNRRHGYKPVMLHLCIYVECFNIVAVATLLT